MKDFVILVDSTCDLSEEARADIGMTDYIPGHAHFSDGRDIVTKLDWSEISREDYYKTLSNKKIQVTTAPPSPAEFYDAFERYAKEDIGVISISLSSKISSTYNFAKNAAEDIVKNYPNAKIYCVDSFRMSGAIGLLAYYAFAMKNEGKSFDEIVAWLEENKVRVHQMGPIDDLIFVARRGRISMGKAIFGSFAGVKPMGDCNADGYTTVLTKAKGINKAFDITVKYVSETATDIENQILFRRLTNNDTELLDITPDNFRILGRLAKRLLERYRDDITIMSYEDLIRGYEYYESNPPSVKSNQIPLELEQQIVDIALDNPTWGSPHILHALRNIGNFQLKEYHVRRVLVKNHIPVSKERVKKGLPWKAFVAAMKSANEGGVIFK